MAGWSPDAARADAMPRPRLARRILLVVLVGYTANGLINISTGRHGSSNVPVSVACLVGAFGFQLLHISRAALGWPLRWKVASLTGQAVLTYAPLVFLSQYWGGMADFLGASCLLLLPQRVAWPLVGLIDVAGMAFAAHYFHSQMVLGILYYGTILPTTALFTFGLTRLSQLAVELHAMRAELARLAVTQERLRFARDLHDLLGYSLSSITLKSELTYRLVPKQPQRAQQELAGILEISRQALADVRAVASSYRAMSLEREAAAAQAMLNEAGIDTVVDIGCGPLPPSLDTVLATTLREGVTNALRHSKVQRFRIAATLDGGDILLELANDGVTGTGASAPARKGGSGSGLENLDARVSAFDGTLAAGVGDDGWFRLAVRVPRVSSAADQESAGPHDCPDESAHDSYGGIGERRDHDPVG